MTHRKKFAPQVLQATLAIVFLCNILAAEKKPPARPIDINVANIKELEELPGIGAITAQRIIDARQKSGKFHRVEDLLVIKGISAKRLEVLRPYIKVSSPLAATSPPKSVSPAKKSPAQ